MDTYTAAHDPDQHIYLKRTVKHPWERCTVDDILACCELPDTILLDKVDKARMPVFGFDKVAGSTKNEQCFPTHFVILELDAPSAWKVKIKEGCQKTLASAKASIYVWYWRLHHSRYIPYYWMYLTPSTCGLRFVLRTNKPVENELHYRQVVLAYLRLLYKFSNGFFHQDHHDILVHQAWFVPIFEERLSTKKQDWNISPYQAEVRKPESRTKYPDLLTSGNTSTDYWTLAIRFTERNFAYRPGQRNNYIHNLACNCNRFGLSQAEVVSYLLSQYDLEESEIRAAVASAYRNNTSEFGQFLNA